ncbi:hypothetical protein O3P69_000629 [Scylla paramamosain]|uniref:Uncharacterized protein n=1 Tax=Scylla paramamosain TaxID=85552 RepID=A0AAW0UT16_SCYPA
MIVQEAGTVDSHPCRLVVDTDAERKFAKADMAASQDSCAESPDTVTLHGAVTAKIAVSSVEEELPAHNFLLYCELLALLKCCYRMEFAEFDDDLFEEKPTRDSVAEDYQARMCEAGWFMQVEPGQLVSQEDELGVQKFAAEYLFLA